MSPKAPGRINIFIHVGRGQKWVAEIGQQCCRARRAFTSSLDNSPNIFTIFQTASPNPSDVVGDIFEFIGLRLISSDFIGIHLTSSEFIGFHRNSLEFIGFHRNS
ncbi:hypothetical protein ALC60_08619 [Trachymyrmex zeteki]|uniref:Uncharacterized protein n=1 Tax=Mycetomoellerius zeteki TaxID=64791 RepID=A0A151WWE9_9HYME|nr:hypothetical protein ALC60_08619 [Trachymyrmex zeteki]